MTLVVARVRQQRGDVARHGRSCTSSTSQPSSTRVASATRRSVCPVVDERRPRLPVAHLRLERVELARRDVRRVRDDEVERPVDAGEQVGLDEGRRRGRARSRSRARARAPRSDDVGRGDARAGTLVLERERDRAAAGADVDDARELGRSREQREAALDDDLRLGARHERARVGLQRQPPEVPVAEHVGERLTRAAPLRRAPAPRRARPRSAAGRAGCRARSARGRARARAGAPRRAAALSTPRAAR